MLVLNDVIEAKNYEGTPIKDTLYAGVTDSGTFDGKLVVLLPQPELDYGYLANSLYMFPRADGVILGGTFEAGNWSMDPDEATTTRIIEGNAQIARGRRGVDSRQ
mgnify:CR=1 FL=1